MLYTNPILNIERKSFSFQRLPFAEGLLLIFYQYFIAGSFRGSVSPEGEIARSLHLIQAVRTFLRVQIRHLPVSMRIQDGKGEWTNSIVFLRTCSFIETVIVLSVCYLCCYFGSFASRNGNQCSAPVVSALVVGSQWATLHRLVSRECNCVSYPPCRTDPVVLDDWSQSDNFCNILNNWSDFVPVFTGSAPVK